MILVDKDIKAGIADGSIVFDPYDPSRVGTNSYDVTLAKTLLVYGRMRADMHRLALYKVSEYEPLTELDCKVEPPTVEIEIPRDGYVLEPGQLYLASTMEYTEAHNTVPFLEGKSSLGRLGLNIHVTAGKGDVNYRNYWTMELTVVHRLRVYAGMPIGQVFFHQITQLPEVDYSSKSSQKYSAPGEKSGNPKPGASKMYKNFSDGVALPRGK